MAPSPRSTAPGRLYVVTGVEELNNAFKMFEKRTQRQVTRKALRPAGDVVKNDAKAMVPVDTGLLESSIKRKAAKRSRNKIGVQVTTGQGLFKGETFYGGHIEYGTKKMEADSYLRPALWGNEDEVKRIFVSVLKEHVRTYRATGSLK